MDPTTFCDEQLFLQMERIIDARRRGDWGEEVLALFMVGWLSERATPAVVDQVHEQLRALGPVLPGRR